jgi:hypothetical protein
MKEQAQFLWAAWQAGHREALDYHNMGDASAADIEAFKAWLVQLIQVLVGE